MGKSKVTPAGRKIQVAASRELDLCYSDQTKIQSRLHFSSTVGELRIKFTTVTPNAEDKDLRDLMREEKSRGTKRRPVNTSEERKKRNLEKDALRAIQSGDLHAFVRMLHEAGVKDGTPAFANALKIFHASAPRR
jgi:hypothetical protein